MSSTDATPQSEKIAYLRRWLLLGEEGHVYGLFGRMEDAEAAATRIARLCWWECGDDTPGSEDIPGPEALDPWMTTITSADHAGEACEIRYNRKPGGPLDSPGLATFWMRSVCIEVDGDTIVDPDAAPRSPDRSDAS